ncbi:MAG: GAF domain-containing sensor histidine kinase [Chloroflexi bacterium]|nr:GAF domain-containing sensor histidine kinase [Chloroflexota bacterium]MCC6892590.1 GAF domain-containing sensor histidine kinase [Anaerolineae bacterium]
MSQPDVHDRNQYLERKVNVLNRLADVSILLNTTYELDSLLTYLMDAAAAITDCEGASVLLWDEQNNDLRFAATTSQQIGLKLIGTSVPLQGSLAGACLTEGRVIQVDDTQQDPRHYTKLDEEKQFETRSLLIAPMRQEAKIIGVLEVVNKRTLPWTGDDHDHLMVLVSQAAVAIDRVQMVTELRKAHQELSELDKLKSDFIAIASHELRTPLAVILGYASFLKDEAQGKMSEHADKVIESGLQLRHIIEDLMNLRYLQQNASDLHLQPALLSSVVGDAVQDVQNLLEANGHTLMVNIQPGIVVQVDTILTAMGFTNILNNAIRFTPPGGQISVKGEMREGAEAWVTISDNGIGIEPHQLERIFEKFYQVEDHMTRKHGGLGVGLSITKALVEAEGGRVWASSDGLGKGTTITVVLRLAM